MVNSWSQGGRNLAIRGAAWIAMVGLWELAASTIARNPSLFPGPRVVAIAMAEWAQSGLLVHDVVASLARVGNGLAIGAAFGVLLGVATGRSQWFARAFGDIMNFFRAIPPVALVPLAILWLGISEYSKTFLVAWGAFFPVWLNTSLGVSRVDPTIEWAARSLGARESRLIRAVVLPSALPYVLAGVRLAIGIAFICVFVAEYAGASEGIGFRIASAYLVFRGDLMLAGLALLGIVAALADLLFRRVTKVLVPWQHTPS